MHIVQLKMKWVKKGKKRKELKREGKEKKKSKEGLIVTYMVMGLYKNNWGM